MFGLISRKRHEEEMKAAIEKAVRKEAEASWNQQRFSQLDDKVRQLEIDVEQLKEAAAGKDRKREARCPMMIRPMRF